MREILPGSRVRVFDPTLFKNDKDTPPSFTRRPATVIRRYGRRSPFYGYVYRDCVDVLFDHWQSLELSRGHFTNMVSPIEFDSREGTRDEA